MTTTRWRDALSGALAAGLALGVSELVAGLIEGVPSLVESLGNWVIDHVPPAVKDWAIAVFGTNDKLALLIGITLVTVLVGAVVGVFARKRFWIAIAVFTGFGVLAILAAVADPRVSLVEAAIPAAVAVIVGLATLRMLFDLGAEKALDDGTRRTFLLGAGAVLGIAALSATAGRFLMERAKLAVAGRTEVELPSPGEVLAAVPAAADFDIEGLTPILVPNDDFYRIDTALSVPRVNLEEWSLAITGLVDRPYTMTFGELLEMPMVERDVTLSCVSNRVGGGLVGNARWQGVPLRDVLDLARVSDEAEQLVARSVDDFTVGFPIDAVYDGREALLAIGMNGEPLPFEHGFPARLVVAGLYGYVSATKWLSEIELTTWDGFDAYWVPRGWAKEGPIKTQSRIDTPSEETPITKGPNVVAGVAWAPNKGITRVEVQLGADADWVEAELSEPLSESAWVQWRVDWDVADTGRHVLRCRATDGDGYTQTEEEAPPAPDGATGWHTVSVMVSAV
ncbi:MAG TPA: molybdopterin-dependent oxidoreductase [Acidimicrobiia bacterium]|nr:molybdopterin-dependent oxidoreductase [Acidimicrobiia bacterium]